MKHVFICRRGCLSALFFLTAAGAPGRSMAAPVVYTRHCYIASYTSVTLYGVVNADSASDPVDAVFYYSTSLSGPWNAVTASQSPIQGTSPVDVTATITTSANQSYWYYLTITRSNPPLDMSGVVRSFSTSPSPMVVETHTIDYLTTSSASMTGLIAVVGCPMPLAHGAVWSTTGSPTISDQTSDLGTASMEMPFFTTIAGLSPNTTYYVRAFATNTEGTVYGDELSFTTYQSVTVTTQEVTDAATTSAIAHGNVTDLGNPAPTAHGFVWNTTGTPTLSDSSADLGAALTTGPFTCSITGLASETTYYVRAFATNEVGTVYGDEVSFDTLPVAAAVTTQAVTDIGATTATGNGTVTDLGSSPPVSHGLCWNESGAPTIDDRCTDQGAAAATGAFTSMMTGLLPETTYHVRAYATNAAGTSYGEDVTFTTEAAPSECGNNRLEQGEVCDGDLLGGATCVDRGHTGGTLACSADCTSFDESLCTDDATTTDPEPSGSSGCTCRSGNDAEPSVRSVLMILLLVVLGFGMVVLRHR